MQWRILGRIIYLSKTTTFLLLTVVGVIFLIMGYYFIPKETTVELKAEDPPKATAFSVQATAEPTPLLWRIYVVGAVKNPGLYALHPNVLVYDLIEAAGGLLPDANAQTINLAQELEPHLMVQILTEEERVAQGRISSLILIKNNVEIGASQITEEQNAKVNINTATKEELMTLSGIGEARAESIIFYREEHGPFQTIEDIMLVSGIKESAFAKIKDEITT